MALKTTKNPAEKYRQLLDFAKALPPDAALASVRVSAFDVDRDMDATGEFLEGTDCEIKGTQALWLVKGGTPGHRYRVTVTADLTTGERLEEDIEVTVNGPRPEPVAKHIQGEAQAVQALSKVEQGLDGKIRKPGQGTSKLSFQLRAFGYGAGDKRRVPSRVTGATYKAKPSGEFEKAGEIEVELTDISVSKRQLQRGRLNTVLAAVKNGVKTEGVNPITVAKMSDGGYVAMDGSHRVAAMRADGKKGKIKVMLMEPKKACASCGPGMTKAEQDALDECVAKKTPILVEEGYAQKQATAIAYATCKKKLGLDKAMAESAAGQGAELVGEGYPKKKRRKMKTAEELTEKEQETKKSASDALGLSTMELERELQTALEEEWGSGHYIDSTYPESQTVIVRYSKPWNPNDTYATGQTAHERMMACPMAQKTGKTSDYWQLEYEIEDHEITFGDPVPAERTFVESEKCFVERENEMQFVAKKVGERFEIALDKNIAPDPVVAGLSEIEGVSDVKAEDGKFTFKLSKETGAQAEVKFKCRATFSEEVEASEALMAKRVELFSKDAKTLEKGIVFGVVYEPDVVDLQNEFAGAPAIEDAAHDWMMKSQVIKRQHKGEQTDDKPVESYIQKEDGYLGSRAVKKGSWILGLKLGKKSLEMYKKGQLKGFSMGGRKVVA